MFKHYKVTLELKYAKNSKGNPHDFAKTIKHQYWDCNFYIVGPHMRIYSNNDVPHDYDLTDIDKITFEQLTLDYNQEKRWEM